MHIFVHIWEDNANLYGTRQSAIDALAEEHDDADQVALWITNAEQTPGEPIYIDGGVSVLRYLTIR